MENGEQFQAQFEIFTFSPDGEPRETTPVRLAREQEEAEEEEERQREMMERLNSAGLQQLQAAIRKKVRF